MFVVFGEGWNSILSIVFLFRQWDCKDDHPKEERDKRLEIRREGWVVGVNPHCQGHFVIRDGSIIPTKVPLTCLVALMGRGPAVTDPPLCSVLQMGGGAVQARAAGVHGGNHAAGWRTSKIKYIPLTCIAI